MADLRKLHQNAGFQPQITLRPWYHVLVKGLKTALADLTSRVFPPLCTGCELPVSQTGTLCGACWQQMRFLEMPLCPVMGIPFSHDFGAHFLSAEAFADPPPFQRLRSVAVHEGISRHASVSLKYHDRLDLAPWMARWMQRSGAQLLAECDVIIPVPLHRKRLIQRRYNQAAELARQLAKNCDKPYQPLALARVKATSQQAALSRSARMRNVAGAFKVAPAQCIHIQGRKILLVDDVYTTGATVKAACRALLRAGAAKVDVLTFSRVLPDH